MYREMQMIQPLFTCNVDGMCGVRLSLLFSEGFIIYLQLFIQWYIGLSILCCISRLGGSLYSSKPTHNFGKQILKDGCIERVNLKLSTTFDTNEIGQFQDHEVM